MSIRRRDEVLVIYIKLCLQLLCILSTVTLLIKKEWIVGNNENTETVICGNLDEFCVKNEMKIKSNNLLHEFYIKERLKRGIDSKAKDQNTDNNNKLLKLNGSNKELDSADLYSPIYKNRKNDNLRQSVLDLGAMNIFYNREDISKNEKATYKYNPVNFYFNSVQYCTSYTDIESIRRWYVHPNYVYYFNLLLILVSMIMNLNITRFRNRWSAFELIIPGLDFVSFTISWLNIAQIISVLSPLIYYFEKTKYNTFFSTNLIFACISIGTLFVTFFLCIGVIHYRYEAYVKFKRFEDQIEDIKSSSMFVHIVSNK